MFEKLAEKWGKKMKDEEEITFKNFDEESELRAQERPEAKAENANLSVTSESDGNIELKLTYPKSFDDVASIADHLLDGCTVVLNMEAMEPKSAMRMLDFLNGVTYTTGGDIKPVAQHTFIITPHNVDVSDDE